MVPNLSKGAGIKGTALYVLHDVRTEGERAIGAELAPEQQSTHRVGMTTTRNLSTDDSDLAWRLMCATASNREALKQAAGIRPGGRQTKNFCGHIALSWEHQTQPDAAEMQRAAAGALQALGWEKLQALIVEHKDHDHSHCHIVVNLIDPETGRTAPNTKNDYEKLQRWAHEYDKSRGLAVCPNRAERMERQPDDPTPHKPTRQWLPRKEYEALRNAERADHRAQAIRRYREAAADVREQFRPEWASLYGDQRAELRALDLAQRGIMRELADASKVRKARVSDAGAKGWIGPAVTVRNRISEFVDAHRADIWRGIDAANHPGNQHTLLQPAFVKRALDRAHAGDRVALFAQHQEAKAELQVRHDEARQDVYRTTWQRPEPSDVLSFPQTPTKPVSQAERGGVRLPAALAASAAGIAAYALSKQGDQARAPNPDRDFDQAAERIARQRNRAANTNRQPERATEASKQPEDNAKAQQPPPQRNELDELRAKAQARSDAIRQQHLGAAAARKAVRAHSHIRSRD